MTSRRLCVAAAVTLCALFCAGVALADPKGLWLAQDGAHVKVGPCGAALCATIATPKSAYDPETGRPWTDKHNPDPAQRGRPLVGVPVLYGLVPDGPGRWSGRLYNVDNGNSYSGHLLELGAKREPCDNLVNQRHTSLNRVGLNSVYRAVCWIARWPSQSWMSRVS
jgi:uncharacterized protein (DUF2147 family)